MNRRELLAAAGGGLLALAGCRRAPVSASPHALVGLTTVVDPARAAAAQRLTGQPLRFTDVTGPAGIDWTYNNGATGRHLFVETTGGGVAFIDYNNDGLLDIFAPQGGPVPGAQGAELAFDRRSALYRNNGNGTFTNVAAAAGLESISGYCQGVAVADYDNDGWQDIYVTAYGGSHLFHNNGDGTFTDVTAKAGVADVSSELLWPLSAAWADYDNDGLLDLFVCHYCRWTPEINKDCPSADHTRLLYCRPQVYEGSVSRLYHNNGDGTFTDVTHKAGIDRLRGKAMGAAWLDYDDDGWPDLFVTNDSMPNYLYHNNRNGTFTETAIAAGAAFGFDGTSMSGMGIAVGDLNNDGREDLVHVNYSGQAKSVYRNLGRGLFRNDSYASNIASTNLQFLGFGLEACDYDLDGHKDLIVGNGHVIDWPDALSGGSTYTQSQQLLHNQGDGTFADDQRSLGDLARRRTTRGLATGDFDNDGDIDVVMVGQNGPLQLFRNDGGNQNAWITLRLEGVRCSRDAVGAKLTATAGALRQTQWVRGGSSYCSHSDRRVTFGLGGGARLDSLEVRWPGGRSQKFGQLEANRFYWLREGAQPVADPRIPARLGAASSRL